ncbi:Iron dependent repressor, diptheria toxin type [Syntrophomonas zehnderi OL-4]|uniref:Iron dependent repressor, diptheria toxin type n=1 Tax=Syntrophomonas zehnderi OL-4 TaxID=690567 RepID=A0A0E4G9N8_9FIRM|nr:metal-dependent transcriptional regulator [Syntrophomonas zehnderi]CFX18185.1 Iron dependent repressor, diptheria toxin type [Syntrophomonas zehnderi OL-4]
MEDKLTPSQEDYLEVILQLSQEDGKATVSDIARQMNIAKPSVNQAISTLHREGLVTQERYGPVYLTETGRIKAQEVWKRHQIINDFLQEILNVSPAVADQDACLMEHVISAETLEKMNCFLAAQPSANQMPARSLTLADIHPGQKARIIKHSAGNSHLKKRLLEMGLVPDTVVMVERFAPLGDPIEILIKSYHVSLRKEEAASLLVELIQD